MSGRVEIQPHTVNGLLVPALVQQEDVDRLKELELYLDDVWIVTFPKSGTKWTAQIVKLIHNSGVQDNQVLDYAVPWAEGMKLYEIRGCKDIKLEDRPRPGPFSAIFPTPTSPAGLRTPHHASTSMLHEIQKM